MRHELLASGYRRCLSFGQGIKEPQVMLLLVDVAVSSVLVRLRVYTYPPYSGLVVAHGSTSILFVLDLSNRSEITLLVIQTIPVDVIHLWAVGR
jgi:hypothetical protein